MASPPTLHHILIIITLDVPPGGWFGLTVVSIGCNEVHYTAVKVSNE